MSQIRCLVTLLAFSLLASCAGTEDARPSLAATRIAAPAPGIVANSRDEPETASAATRISVGGPSRTESPRTQAEAPATPDVDALEAAPPKTLLRAEVEDDGTAAARPTAAAFDLREDATELGHALDAHSVDDLLAELDTRLRSSDDRSCELRSRLAALLPTSAPRAGVDEVATGSRAERAVVATVDVGPTRGAAHASSADDGTVGAPDGLDDSDLDTADVDTLLRARGPATEAPVAGSDAARAPREGEFALLSVTIASEISGPGDYVPIRSKTFRPGQTVYLYGELTGFEERFDSDADASLYTRSFSGSLSLLDPRRRTVDTLTFLTRDEDTSSSPGSQELVNFWARYRFPADLRDGTHEVHLIAHDLVGQQVARAILEVTIDPAAPLYAVDDGRNE